jgi:O-antigen ligase
MISRTSEKILGYVLLSAGPVISLFITPFTSVDPVNQSKMVLLVPCALVIFSILLVNYRVLIKAGNLLFLVLCILFISQLLLILFFSGAPFNQQFYGTFGRNTGFLTYASLVVIAVGASYVASVKFLEKVSLALIITGLISAIYCFLQTFKWDPVAWSNPYNSIVGFLGNPNFASSFLAITAISVFAYLLRLKLNLLYRISSALYILLALFLIVRSNSQQGLLVFGAGSALVFLLFLIGTPRFSKKPIILLYSGFSLFIGLIVISATLNKGPLASVIYKLSVRQRGFYWDSAISMMQSHPIFGVGLDSYGDWYLATRSTDAAFYTPLTTSNSAHNVFLELGATGGIPLFIINISLVLVTAWSAIKYLRRQSNFDWAYAGLLGAWVGYESQALISINQIGLVIWGWLLMGLLVGIEFRTREIFPNQIERNRNSGGFGQNVAKEKGADLTKVLASSVAGLTLALIVVIPAFLSDANFRSGLGSKDANRFIEAIQAKPIDNSRMVQGAQVLAKSNLIPQANFIVDKVIADNPRFYNAWELKLQLAAPNSEEALKAKEVLDRLNPKVPVK